MPAPDPRQKLHVPRITSHALAMRPKTRRIFMATAAASIVLATAVGAGVAYLGDYLAYSSPVQASNAAMWGGLGALVAAVLGVGAVPLARRLLIRRADVRLIEAASPVHPLLKRLMTEAPGTYAHSLATASLAESAAEAVGADPLLARVGAYYHDIGKIKRPCYFFENLANGDNPHDAAKPSLSALIITSHVTDGLDLAQEYDLPRRVIDVIREHHGTSLIRYFYHKATALQPGVAEGDFRYHGGRPTSRESAMVMLADSSEAAVRALTEPDADDIALVVRGVIEEKIDDHQLELTDLSREELGKISEMFSRMLVGMLHARCEYPRHPLGPMKEDHADQRRESSRT